MALRKFGPNEIVLNTMRTYPHVEYTIYDGVVYYNNIPRISGSTRRAGEPAGNIDIRVVSGGINLYEYNIDRIPTETGRYVPQSIGSDGIPVPAGIASVPDTGMIYPFITKDSARSTFKTISPVSYTNEFANYDLLTANYPLSGTIAREIMWHPELRNVEVDNHGFPGIPASSGNPEYQTLPVYPHFYALKNRLNHYGYLSPNYPISKPQVTGAFEAPVWDKGKQVLNLISIPAIAFGSKIQPGTVSLKWYYTGSLIGELKDPKEDGDLIETIGDYSGTVAGVCAYDEGFMVLTGAWDIQTGLTNISVGLSGSSFDDVYVNKVDAPKWIYFGAGAYDGNSSANSDAESFVTASFNMSFKGQTDIQVYTLFAIARRGEVNYSNNPTFFEYGQEKVAYNSSTVYEENSTRKIKNTVSSSYLGYNAPFKRQVFISRVGIYDDNKNLIGMATLADPILKKEDDDYTFKIKLDI